MYVTRPLPMYKKSLADLSASAGGSKLRHSCRQRRRTTCCFELSNIDMIKELPFPQNKSLELYYATWFYPNRDLQFHGVFFIPVLDPYGKDKGEGYTSANEDSMDMETCCFDSCTNDGLPQRFDPKDMYQQYKINHCYGL